MLRGSLTSDKNKKDRSCWKVPGAHTLLMSEGDEQFHIKRFKGKKRLEIPEKALARGVALLGVKVTGIEPPRLTFVTV